MPRAMFSRPVSEAQATADRRLSSSAANRARVGPSFWGEQAESDILGHVHEVRGVTLTEGID